MLMQITQMNHVLVGEYSELHVFNNNSTRNKLFSINQLASYFMLFDVHTHVRHLNVDCIYYGGVSKGIFMFAKYTYDMV